MQLIGRNVNQRPSRRSVAGRVDSRVVGVVHEVGDAYHQRLLQVRPPDQRIDVSHVRIGEGIFIAGITASWATESGGFFGGGIRNQIPIITSIFESMVKSHPVTS